MSRLLRGHTESLRWAMLAVSSGVVAVLLLLLPGWLGLVPEWVGGCACVAVLAGASAIAGYRARTVLAAIAFALIAVATPVLPPVLLFALRLLAGPPAGDGIDPALALAVISITAGLPAVAFCIIVSLVAHTIPAARRRRACGYTLAGLPGPCPECGA
jgi:hypothetical protein